MISPVGCGADRGGYQRAVRVMGEVPRFRCADWELDAAVPEARGTGGSGEALPSLRGYGYECPPTRPVVWDALCLSHLARWAGLGLVLGAPPPKDHSSCLASPRTKPSQLPLLSPFRPVALSAHRSPRLLFFSPRPLASPVSLFSSLLAPPRLASLVTDTHVPQPSPTPPTSPPPPAPSPSRPPARHWCAPARYGRAPRAGGGSRLA